MQNSFLANSDVKKVSLGMMAVVDSLQNYSKSERHAIILSVFNCYPPCETSRSRLKFQSACAMGHKTIVQATCKLSRKIGSPVFV